jgi:hydrogenase nickel incorporation protein HypA/HybF
MHELAVTENLLEIAIRHGNTAGAKKISKLYLVVGQLSSIVDDSVQFYWDIISKGTVAEGAKLHFHRNSLVLNCKECAQQFTPIGDDLSCPSCGSIQIQVISGEEFYLEAIDVET